MNIDPSAARLARRCRFTGPMRPPRNRGGRANVAAAELDDWTSSLWRGRFIAAFICLLAGQAVMADQVKVFEWRDASGHVSYSNLAPPPGAKDVTAREIEAYRLRDAIVP
jgi:hypothetical protein